MDEIHLNQSFKQYKMVFIQAQQLGHIATEDLIENGIVQEHTLSKTSIRNCPASEGQRQMFAVYLCFILPTISDG